MDITTPVWVPIVVAVVSAIPSTIAAFYGVHNKGRLERLEINVDGRLTELLNVTAISSKAEGAKEEKDRGSS